MNRVKTRKLVDEMVRERGLTKTEEELEEMVDTLMFNVWCSI